ncbi:RHS repeat-associated core domain-containing protein, partial [Roseateles sp.]|uniref:RHS repeat-associated core domain-containing protein n=1 Tax=Roseateles sp. TaxID=1971397 RepID=UPI0031DC8EE7
PTKVIKAKGVSGFGFATSNAYDALDRVKTNTDARNGVTTLGYDGLDQLKQVTDPRQLVTSYQRNGLGDLNQLTSPDTGTANSTFDANGNLLTRTDSRGVLGTYVYDGLDRMTSAVYTKSGQTTVSYSWTYDQTGATFGAGIGRLTTATSPAGNTKYGYDGFGRVVSVIQTVGSVVLTTRYGYDLAGHITSITYPSGRVLTITYANGVPASMSLAKDGSSAAKPLISQIQWMSFGAIQSWQMQLNSGAKAQERVYDQYGRLVRYPLGSVVRDITYDAADRIVSYTHLDATTGQVTAEAQAMNQSFSYDEMGRLTGIVMPTASWTIGYDANGNRTGFTLNGTTSTYTTETTSNRLSSIANPARSFAYDPAGNTLSDTGIAYTATYGLDNRLASLTRAGVTTTFNYDAAGQRVRKVTGTSKPHFAYDQNGQLLGEYNSSGGVLQEFVWLGGTLIAVLTNSTTTEPRVYYAYSDHLNAPRVIVNAAGDVRWRWISEPFGTTAAESIPNSLENLVVNLRFPGQYFDKESGLSYNYFRDYDGTTGRYVQTDPIGLGGGINTYAYANGNPLSFYDPYGLWGMDDVYGAIYNWTGGREPSQELVNFSAGLGDELLLGQGQRIRNLVGVNGGINRCSGAYGAGQWTGVAALTAAGGIAGARGLPAGAKMLSNSAKGQIGEAASLLNNWLKGSSLLGTQVEIQGLTTVVDSAWLSRNGVKYFVESKFGTAGLTRAQRIARRVLGDAYHVERWTYDWVTKVGAVLGGAAGAGVGAASTDNCICQ